MKITYKYHLDYNIVSYDMIQYSIKYNNIIWQMQYYNVSYMIQCYTLYTKCITLYNMILYHWIKYKI